MRGVPNTSLNIFNKMKASKGEAQLGGSSSSTGGYTSNSSNSIREGALEGGGAYETMQRMLREQSSKVNPTVGTTSSTAGAVFKSIKETKTIKTVSVGSYVDDMISLLSTNSDNLDNAIKVLLFLYLNNDLDSYEISGLDRSTIIETLRDFTDVLDRVLK